MMIIDRISNDIDVTERMTTELRRHLERQQRTMGAATGQYDLITNSGRVVVTFVSNSNEQMTSMSVDKPAKIDSLALIRARIAALAIANKNKDVKSEPHPMDKHDPVAE